MLPLVVGLAVLAGLIGLCWLVPESRLVARQWRVLVPFASGWLAALLLAGAGVHLALLSHSPRLPMPLLATGLQLSLLAILVMLIEVFVAAWVTPLLARVAAGERAADHLWSCFREAPSWMPRMFGGLLVGHALPVGGVLLVAGGVANGVFNDGNGLALVVAFALIVCPLWSVVTGSLLFELLDREQSFGVALQNAVHFGRTQGIHWWRLVVAQAVLAGALVVLPDRIWVHAMWLGGYSVTNHWFDDAQKLQAMPLAGVFGAVLFVASVVTVATIKLRIAGVRQAVRATKIARAERPLVVRRVAPALVDGGR
jgi:hypothetical protein